MFGNARAYRLHPVTAKSTPEAWLQLIKTIKRLKTENISLIIYTLICTIIYSCSQSKKYNMFTLIQLITKISWLLKTVMNNDRTKTVDIISCLHSIASPLSTDCYCIRYIYKRNYYTCEMMLHNIRTYRIQYIPNVYII